MLTSSHMAVFTVSHVSMFCTERDSGSSGHHHRPQKWRVRSDKDVIVTRTGRTGSSVIPLTRKQTHTHTPCSDATLLNVPQFLYNNLLCVSVQV